MRAVSLLPFLVLAATACGRATSGDPDGGGGPDASTGPDAFRPDADIADFSKVYAHSGTVLYRLDTTTLMPVEVGPFTNLGTQSMTDIAIDKNDRMLGVTLTKVFEVDETTGACTHRADLELGTPNVTSLSFVPVDLNQPDGTEILVAATDDGSVYQLDPTTGASTLIGSYGTTGNGQLIRSSGDIVAVRGLGILATVTVGDTLTDPDYLALIDPADWHATLLGSGASYDKIFGVGFWRDTIYGFVDLGAGAGGAIIALDRVTGGATLVNQGTVRWYGAGVTTNAPVVD